MLLVFGSGLHHMLQENINMCWTTPLICYITHSALRLGKTDNPKLSPPHPPMFHSVGLGPVILDMFRPNSDICHTTVWQIWELRRNFSRATSVHWAPDVGILWSWWSYKTPMLMCPSSKIVLSYNIAHMECLWGDGVPMDRNTLNIFSAIYSNLQPTNTRISKCPWSFSSK